ncbi:UNVERIFIED_CONTAM: hypothetical protein FKN15_061533 [Acipenser sinensis]
MENISQKDLVIGGLKLTKTSLSIIGKWFPIVGLFEAIPNAILNEVDDTKIKNLKEKFDCIDKKCQDLCHQMKLLNTKVQVQTLEAQYYTVLYNIENSFEAFKDYMMAIANTRDEKVLEEAEKMFKAKMKRYELSQNLNTPYEGVVGVKKIFSEPILEVYLKHNNPAMMKTLCERLKNLLENGISAFLCETAITHNEEVLQKRSEEWK